MILLVDDDTHVLETYTFILKKKGYDVISCLSGQDALLQFETHKHDIFAVVTDYNMPEMNGIQLIHAIEQKMPDIKTVLFSGLPPEQIPDHVTVLRKPINTHLLLEILKKDPLPQ